MSARLRLLLTVLLVGGAVLMVHVGTSINRPDSHHAATHDNHEDCADDHCSGQPSHLVAFCSMILVVLGGAVLIARRFGASIRSAVATVAQSGSSVGSPTGPPLRPPDLAVLSVMRC